MDRRTQIEKNPPLGGNCGWGNETDTADWKLYGERIEAEKSENAGCYIEAREAVLAKGAPTPMELLVAEHMKTVGYDGGIDLDVIDKLLYGGPAYVDQDGVGSCVGAGCGSAVATKAATELLLEGDPENPFGLAIEQYSGNAQQAVPCIDYHYGCGKMRSYWSNDRFTRSNVRMGDGSYCSVQIWALETCGVLPCSAVTKSGLVFPQTKSIRSHAGNGGDFLNNHAPIAMKHRMKDSVRVRNADDLGRVIRELKQPCMICSNWGFGPRSDIGGPIGWVYRRQGSWAHNMSLVADVDYKGERYVKVRNQWGANAHKDGWHFWIPIDLMASWLRSAECQSIGELSLMPLSDEPSFPF